MTDSADPTGALAATKHALGRVQALRDRGVPFDPVVEIASLREMLAEKGGAHSTMLAADLESVCDRVETAWAELDLRRASVAYLALTVRRRRGRSSPTLDAAAQFLKTWNRPFVDAPEVEARAQFVRRLETLLLEQLAGGAPPLAGLPGSAAPAEATVSPNPVVMPAPSSAGPAAPAVAAAQPALPPVGTPPVAPSTPAASRPPTAAGASQVAAEAGGPSGGSFLSKWLGMPVSRWIRTPSGVTFLVIAAFMIVGAYDRLHALGALSLWNDEAQSTLVSFTILQHGYPVITAKHLVNDYEPLYPYLEAGSIAILGHSNFAYRLPAALLGIASIPLAYYIGSRLRDRYVGLTLAAMMALSSEFTAWSRQARWYILIVVLMAGAFLVAMTWARTPSAKRRRYLLLGLFGLSVLIGLSSIGLFLLYIPAVLVGILTYATFRWWPEIAWFFGLRRTPGEPLPPARFVPYGLRQLLVIVVPLVLLVVAIVKAHAIGELATSLAARLLGFTPYPVVWSTNFGSYLEQYYLGILLLAVLGGVFILLRRDPVELGLLAFCIAGFVSVSTLASLTNDIAGGNTSFERHLLPFLFFLFVIAAIGIVELIRKAYQFVSRVPSDLPKMRVAKPAVFALLIVVLLLVPGVVAPSGLTVHEHPAQFPTGQLIAWEPFQFDAKQPSAVYQADQADYEYAAAYVASHRVSTDVVGATNPGAPQVYLGQVQYWIRGDPLNNTVLYQNGQPVFFQTGSVLISTTASFEGLLFNTTGWLISDEPGARGGATFPGGMGLVLTDLMSTVPGGSGPSETLFHWNRTSPAGILATVASENTYLRKMAAANESAYLDWAATNGSTWSNLRPLFLPFESYLVQQTSVEKKWLAVLFLVYNHRPGLQSEYPKVLEPKGNDTALIHWAKEVVDGTLGDPAQPALEPYRSYYDEYG
ncbi:MAG TPA: glycosyltransferase family 39 protein [Thermoplasmata archaeon]|nr:glycosyltransferase family 39 protein [Thermoplasmata archaeon]